MPLNRGSYCCVSSNALHETISERKESMRSSVVIKVMLAHRQRRLQEQVCDEPDEARHNVQHSVSANQKRFNLAFEHCHKVAARYLLSRHRALH